MHPLIDKVLFDCVLILFLFSLNVPAKKHKHPPSQWEENCPSICHCNKTHIECKDGHVDDTDVFLSIKDNFYPYLDTLVITGNNLTAIESENLFGEGVVHDRLTFLDLSNNNISHLNSRAFESTIKNVQILKFSTNRIRTVTGDLLVDLPRLQELWLDGAFDQNLTHRELAGLLARIFEESSNELTDLTELHLENNNIQYLPDAKFFCAMPALKRIYLNNNRLANFKAQLSCIQTVQDLDLSGNNIKFLDNDTVNIFEKMEKLYDLKLGDNPYVCDCYISPFVKWFQKDLKRPNSVISDEQDCTCFKADPAEFDAETLANIEADKLLCPDSDKPYVHTVYIFIALALVGLFLTLACLVYQNKGPFLKTVQGRNTRYETVAGYSRLGREPEVTAEFV